MHTTRQSLTAIQKSYDAGVNNTIDVLSSIKMLFQEKINYAVAVTQQFENYSNLLLIQVDYLTHAIKQAQKLMFTK